MKSPDFFGKAGSAWRIKLPDPPIRPAHKATLIEYLVAGIGYHPLWNHWYVSLISLEEIPGVPSAKKYYPEATYEIMVVALNPDKPLPDPDRIHEKTSHILRPIDGIYQFHGVTDDEAKEMVTDLVKEIVAGQLSPDSDFRETWRLKIAKRTGLISNRKRGIK